MLDEYVNNLQIETLELAGTRNKGGCGKIDSCIGG